MEKYFPFSSSTFQNRSEYDVQSEIEDEDAIKMLIEIDLSTIKTISDKEDVMNKISVSIDEAVKLVIESDEIDLTENLQNSSFLEYETKTTNLLWNQETQKKSDAIESSLNSKNKTIDSDSIIKKDEQEKFNSPSVKKKNKKITVFPSIIFSDAMEQEPMQIFGQAFFLEYSVIKSFN